MLSLLRLRPRYFRDGDHLSCELRLCSWHNRHRPAVRVRTHLFTILHVHVHVHVHHASMAGAQHLRPPHSGLRPRRERPAGRGSQVHAHVTSTLLTRCSMDAWARGRSALSYRCDRDAAQLPGARDADQGVEVWPPRDLGGEGALAHPRGGDQPQATALFSMRASCPCSSSSHLHFRVGC